MTTEIEIEKGWIENEALLMTRISHIIHAQEIEGKDRPPWKKPNSENWQLDRAKNYFAHIWDGRLILESRYGGPRHDSLVEFLKIWLNKYEN